METKEQDYFKQPKIEGYRQLTPTEAELINRIKVHGNVLNTLVTELRLAEGLDQRWVSIGSTDLQTGLMALVRAVAKPTSF